MANEVYNHTPHILPVSCIVVNADHASVLSCEERVVIRATSVRGLWPWCEAHEVSMLLPPLHALASSSDRTKPREHVFLSIDSSF